MTGKELQEFRRKQGWTQNELGAKLGVSGNTVARWERDEVGIPPYLELALQTLERKKK